jgi:Arc/MetJ family transcription regulator
MRTNIVLEDTLVQEAFKLAAVTTKKDLVNLALQEFVANHKRLDLRDLRGKIRFRKDYDYKKLRQGIGQ